jgi:hypothetical protein
MFDFTVMQDFLKYSLSVISTIFACHCPPCTRWLGLDRYIGKPINMSYFLYPLSYFLHTSSYVLHPASYILRHKGHLDQESQKNQYSLKVLCLNRQLFLLNLVAVKFIWHVLYLKGYEKIKSTVFAFFGCIIFWHFQRIFWHQNKAF